MAKDDARTTGRAEGVDALVEQLKQDGIDAGQSEAERIVRDARKEADRIVNEARDEAEATLSRGKEELERERQAVEDGLRQASRDALLTLQSELASRLRARIEELCAEAMCDPDFLRALLLAAVGREVPGHERLEVAVTVLGQDADGVSDDDAASKWLGGELSELLREGVSLSVRAGEQPALTIAMPEREARIEATPRALAELLWERMIPRFRHLLSFEE
ncbi:MAG: hypothetical protein PVI30_16940 [Myxococcales bacterium]|jgi:V/A-type H+-transporting ATPase subunit E